MVMVDGVVEGFVEVVEVKRIRLKSCVGEDEGLRAAVRDKDATWRRSYNRRRLCDAVPRDARKVGADRSRLTCVRPSKLSLALHED
jgi:hypothetical protein